MTILVKLDDSLNAWGIIELQGDLESRVGSSLESQFVGDLHYGFQSNGVPILIIGHHILYGKCVTMDKPYAVIQKVGDENTSGGKGTQYLVKALVKQKLLFKIRPKPIIAATPGM
uniref:Chromosome transmission fidelity protein 8-like protein n=1 Tax=Triatoma infestans TaxID=30076 RepID=A0A023FA17_TRIIF